MLTLLSWNIQYGKGVDDRIDLCRIRDDILETADADIVCLQEVSRFEPGTSKGADQVQAFQEFFPDYEAFYGPAYDRSEGVDGQRRQFGNLVLSRIQVKQVVHPVLPSPPDPENRFMLRQASELQLSYHGFSFRLVNTHLEYFSEKQQLEQVHRLRELHQLACAMNLNPGIDMPGTPFEQLNSPVEVIICGDFNFTPQSELYRQMLASTPENIPILRDAWNVLHPGEVRDPTCGVFDRKQWEEGPHCRDYYFVSRNLEQRLESISINLATRASEHQPVVLQIRDR